MNIFNKRSLKYGSNAAILIIVVVAIAVMLNYIVGLGSLKLDLTANKLYSIGDTTKGVLKGLNKDVTIYGLFDDAQVSSNDTYKAATELLNQYKKYSHVKIQYVDPDKNPSFIKANLDPDGTKKFAKGDFAVKVGNKIKHITQSDLTQTQFDQQTFQQYATGFTAEQAFTGAIKYVTSDVTPVVYFIEGHGENKLDSDFTNVKAYLEHNNYETKTVNLTTQQGVPKDAAILMVASPKSDLTSDEADKIQKYLKDGGKAIFLFDSLQTGTNFTNFDSVLNGYNVSLNYDQVKENDDNRHVPGDNYAILPDLQSNAINSANLDTSNFLMIMPKSRSLNILKNQKEYITVTSLLKTSDKAVGEQIDKSKGADNKGPLDLAIAVENKGGAKPSNILVMGNGSFMTDAAISQYQQYSVNGLYFFLNSLSWMQDKKDDNLIAPKPYSTEQLSMSATQANVVMALVIVVLPLIILGCGLFVWMRRRHL